MYEYFHNFCPFFHLSGCPAQNSCKAGEQEPEVMHFLRAGTEHRISNLLQGANTQKCSTVLLTSRAAHVPWETLLLLSQWEKFVWNIIFGCEGHNLVYRGLSRSGEGSVQTLCILSSRLLISVLPLLSSPAHFRATPETKQLQALQRAPGWSAC